VWNILDKAKYFGLRKIYYVLLGLRLNVKRELSYINTCFRQEGILGKKNNKRKICIAGSYEEGYFQGIGSNYDGVEIPLNLLRKKIYQERINELRKHLGNLAGKRILDIGCGVGTFLSICDNHGMQTFGIDISTYALKEAFLNTKAKLAQVDLIKDRFPFTKNSFNAVTVFDVVEHIGKDDLLFENCRRVLKKDGILYLVTPNGIQKADNDYTHINLKRINYWNSYCKQFGFKILNSYIYKWYPPFPYLISQKILRVINIIRRRYIEQAVIIAKKEEVI